MPIAIGVAGSDLSTLLIEVNAIQDTRFARTWLVSKPDGPRFTIEIYDPSEGATQAYERDPDYTVFVGDEEQAMRCFSEITGGAVVEPEAFRGSA